MITKGDMEGRARRSKKSDGGKGKLGTRSYLWTCSSPKDSCTGKFNSKINNYAHGSKEDAIRCMKRSSKLKEASNDSELYLQS